MAAKFDDSRVEAIIGGLLRTGVILAATVVLAGGVLFLYRFGTYQPDYATFHGEPAQLRGVRSIITAAIEGHSRGLIQLGLLLLIATPVARVAFSVYAFARERDFKYVVFSLIVLGLLAYSLLGPRGE